MSDLHDGPNDSGIDSLSTGPLARPFALSLAPFTRSLAPSYSLRLATLTSSFAHSPRLLPRWWESG